MGITCGLTFLLPILIIELITAEINWQCINVQDYNIARYKYSENILKKIEKQNQKKRNLEYTEGKQLIGILTQNNENIPTIQEIISSIKTKEQAAQIRDWAKSLQQYTNQNCILEKIKK